jgi:hypothetical protein
VFVFTNQPEKRTLRKKTYFLDTNVDEDQLFDNVIRIYGSEESYERRECLDNEGMSEGEDRTLSCGHA